MTFILKDNIICAGKYVVNQESGGRTCSINLLSSSDNIQTEVCDSSGNNVHFDIGAYSLILEAIHKHWTYIDLSEWQL